MDKERQEIPVLGRLLRLREQFIGAFAKLPDRQRRRELSVGSIVVSRLPQGVAQGLVARNGPVGFRITIGRRRFISQVGHGNCKL